MDKGAKKSPPRTTPVPLSGRPLSRGRGRIASGFPSFFLFTPFHSFAMTQPLPDPRSSLSHFTAQEVQHYDSRIPSLVPGYAVLHYGGAALLG